MLFNKLNIKLFSLLLIISLISALAPTLTIGAAEDNLIYTTDFSDSPNISLVTTASASFSTGSGLVNKMYVYNPKNEGEPGTPGTGTISLSEDSKYGNVLTLNKSATWWKNGFGVGIQTDAFDKSKNLVIETAIKRSELSGAALSVNLQGKSDGDSAYDSAKGFELVRFEKNGDLNVNKDMTLSTQTKAGKYEADTWYELKMEYSPSNKFACITINGGIYENVLLYCSEMSGNQAYRVDIGFDKNGAVAANVADFSLAYLNVYYTEPKSLDTMDINTQISFETLPLAEALSGDTSYRALGFYASSPNSPHFGIGTLDAAHGKSLKAKNVGAVKQLEYTFQKPYLKTVTSGCLVIELSANIASGMSMDILAYANSTLPSGRGYFNDKVTAGETYGSLTVQANKWYNFVYVFDIDGNAYTRTVYDPANPADSYTTAPMDITGSGGFRRFDFRPHGLVADDNAYTYVDDILIYTEPTKFEIIKSTPVNGAGDVSYTDEIMLKFNHELKVDSAALAGMISLSSEGNVPSYDVYLMPCGRSVLIKFASPLDYNETYTVGISGIADSAGNVISNSKALNFTMADFITVSKPIFKNSSGKKLSALTSGEVTASVNVRFNDNDVHPVLMFYGIYSKADNTLCQAKTQALTDVSSASFELTLDIPDDTQYYAELCILDTYAGLKPYVKKFRLE